MATCNPTGVPAEPEMRLSRNQSPSNNEEALKMQRVPYREAVGALLYLTISSRPDIAFAVGQVSQFVQNPGIINWKAVKKILSYLAGTADATISFGPNETNLTGYTDADYGGDIDTRRSTNGYIFMLNGGPIAWASRKQTCTATSTIQAEYVAASEAAKEANWLSHLLSDIRKANTNCTAMVRQPECHKNGTQPSVSPKDQTYRY